MKTKNDTTTHVLNASLLGGALLGLCLTLSSTAGNGPTPGHAKAFGATLAQWQETYLRWEVGDITIPPDANGNAAVNNVVLLGVPGTPGDGTPGHLDVTLNTGQAFFLPLLQLAGTSYTDGTPPDPLIDLSYFASVDVSVRIDGVPVIGANNKMDYFSQFAFIPPVPFPFGNLSAIIWFQGFGLAHTPMSAGTHTIQLDEKAGQALPPNFGGGTLEYHNTWTITVQP
jgi:hypothetical protein